MRTSAAAAVVPDSADPPPEGSVKVLSVMKVATVAVAVVTIACGCFLQVF